MLDSTARAGFAASCHPELPLGLAHALRAAGIGSHDVGKTFGKDHTRAGRRGTEKCADMHLQAHRQTSPGYISQRPHRATMDCGCGLVAARTSGFVLGAMQDKVKRVVRHGDGLKLNHARKQCRQKQ